MFDRTLNRESVLLTIRSIFKTLNSIGNLNVNCNRQDDVITKMLPSHHLVSFARNMQFTKVMLHKHWASIISLPVEI